MELMGADRLYARAIEAEPILPGYVWDARTHNYHYLRNMQFVSRPHILRLLDNQLNDLQRQAIAVLADVQIGQISPATGLAALNLSLKREVLTNAALAAGGWDRLTPTDFGRCGGILRAQYRRATDCINGLVDGTVSPAQAANRVNMYFGRGREMFYEMERERLGPAPKGKYWAERRLLEPTAENCPDCIYYAAQGWRPAGELPVPGAASQCNGNCRCQLQRRAVDTEAYAKMLAGEM